MRCENCRYFIKKLKCEITGDSMSRYDGCERGEYRETEKVVCKECKYFFRYDYGYYICRRRNDCHPRVGLYESCDKGERRGYEE